MHEFLKKRYVIAELGISMYTPWEQKLSKEFEEFLNGSSENSYQVLFNERNCLPAIRGKKVFENHGFAVLMDENGTFYRRFCDARKGDNVYAMMHADIEERKVFVEYLPERICHFGSSRKDFFHIGWEKILISERRMILHSACVETPFGGILFSGPSGIGKSTQANLWCEYKHSKLLNGDRVVIRKAEAGWTAYGSPYAGSSKCHLNESCMIKAIIMLKQTESCSIRKMPPLEAFRKVYEQTTVNSWDKDYVSKVSNLILELVQKIPVYELECTPDQAAIELLAEELGKEG